MRLDAMRARRTGITALSLLAALLLLLAVGAAIDARISAVWRVALDSIDDPAAQEHDEATPANAPNVHHGGEAAARITIALTRVFGHLAPPSEGAASLGVVLVPVPRAPPSL
jgi:hypothetical protein